MVTIFLLTIFRLLIFFSSSWNYSYYYNKCLLHRVILLAKKALNKLFTIMKSYLLLCCTLIQRSKVINIFKINIAVYNSCIHSRIALRSAIFYYLLHMATRAVLSIFYNIITCHAVCLFFFQFVAATKSELGTIQVEKIY